MTPSPQRLLILAGLVLAGLGAAPVGAASDHALGDGSETDNPDLVEAGYEPAPVAYPYDDPCGECAEAAILAGDGLNLREPYAPFFDIDWSLSLRGAYVHSNINGERFEALLLPRVSLTHVGNRAGLVFDADALIIKSLTGGELRLAALSANSAFDYAIDSLSVFSAGASLNVFQDAADDPLDLTDPNGIVSDSQSISGAVDAAISRQFGKFDVALRGSLARTVYGPTITVAPPPIDNSTDNFTAAAGGLRVGFELTPILTAFADGSVEHDWFDLPSPVLLLKQDATTYTGKAGIAGKWDEVFEAEASVGLALRQFDDPRISEVVATLYDATLIFRPDEDWMLRASFSTNINPPSAGDPGTARIDYFADADVSYLLNSWVTLRASAAWYATDYTASAASDTGYGFGLGADYLVADHIVLNADYAFTHDELTPDPPEDAHRIMIGVTIQR